MMCHDDEESGEFVRRRGGCWKTRRPRAFRLFCVGITKLSSHAHDGGLQMTGWAWEIQGVVIMKWL